MGTNPSVFNHSVLGHMKRGGGRGGGVVVAENYHIDNSEILDHIRYSSKYLLASETHKP